MSPSPEIDAVFLWVDGERHEELNYWRRRLFAQVAPADIGPSRWRDNGELRYALRSLSVNAPWIRRVHLVTAGEVPAWLDESAPGLQIVRHDELFPDPSVLPTFNSAAIEAVLHRIPGLAQHYLSFNDDVMLGRPIHPSAFLTSEGGTVVYVERWPPPSSLVATNVRDRILAFNRLVVGTARPRMLPHTAILFDLPRVREVSQRFAPHLERTLTHRFRAGDDGFLPFLYCNVLLATGPPHRAVENDGHNLLVRVGWHRDLSRVLAEIRDRQPLTFCVNDDVDDFERDGWMWDEVRSFLEEQFPVPSPFELQAHDHVR